MKEWLTKLRNNIRHYNGVFRQNKEAVNERNRSFLLMSSASGFVIFACLLITSFFIAEISSMWIPYLAVTLFFLMIFHLTYFCHHINAMVLAYFAFLCSVAYSIATSIIISPNDVCVTILAFIFVFSVLYVDENWRIDLVTFIVSICYLVITLPFKNSLIRSVEVADVLSFCVAGLLIGSFARRTIVENFDMKRALNIMAYTDVLTGLGNRRSLFEELEKKNFTILTLLDVDKFKDYNDEYGHQAGDDALAAIGKCLQGFEEKTHIVFYRYGGEEFVGVSKGHSSTEILLVMDQIRKTIPALTTANGKKLKGELTVSIGISSSKMSDGDYNVLLKESDIASYEAKRRGRNQTVVYNDTISKFWTVD